MLDFLRRLFPKKVTSSVFQERPQRVKDIKKPKILTFFPEQIQFYEYCKRTNNGLETQIRESCRGLLKNILANPSSIGLYQAGGYAGIPMPTGETGEPEYIDVVFFLRGRVYVCALSDASFAYNEASRGIFQNKGEDISLASQRLETACNYVYTHFKFQPYALLARSPEKSGVVIFRVFSTKKK